MIFARIAFRSEVPSPKAASIARSHWIQTFDRIEYVIQRDGDTVYITHRESGQTFLYPWANVSGGELEQQGRKPKAAAK